MTIERHNDKPNASQRLENFKQYLGDLRLDQETEKIVHSIFIALEKEESSDAEIMRRLLQQENSDAYEKMVEFFAKEKVDELSKSKPGVEMVKKTRILLDDILEIRAKADNERKIKALELQIADEQKRFNGITDMINFYERQGQADILPELVKTADAMQERMEALQQEIKTLKGVEEVVEEKVEPVVEEPKEEVVEEKVEPVVEEPKEEVEEVDETPSGKEFLFEMIKYLGKPLKMKGVEDYIKWPDYDLEKLKERFETSPNLKKGIAFMNEKMSDQAFQKYIQWYIGNFSESMKSALNTIEYIKSIYAAYLGRRSDAVEEKVDLQQFKKSKGTDWTRAFSKSSYNTLMPKISTILLHESEERNNEAIAILDFFLLAMTNKTMQDASLEEAVKVANSVANLIAQETRRKQVIKMITSPYLNKFGNAMRQFSHILDTAPKNELTTLHQQGAEKLLDVLLADKKAHDEDWD